MGWHEPSGPDNLDHLLTSTPHVSLMEGIIDPQPLVSAGKNDLTKVFGEEAVSQMTKLVYLPYLLHKDDGNGSGASVDASWLTPKGHVERF